MILATMRDSSHLNDDGDYLNLVHQSRKTLNCRHKSYRIGEWTNFLGKLSVADGYWKGVADEQKAFCVSKPKFLYI